MHVDLLFLLSLSHGVLFSRRPFSSVYYYTTLYLNMLHVYEFEHTTRSNLLNLEARGKGLLELISLVGVSNAKGVEVAAAADLELGDITSLLDLDGSSVLAASRKEELLDTQEHSVRQCSLISSACQSP